ncbi:MAG: hypothetical protein C4532_10745 [Candidatus Abyssobacteria bacterium SURF_17]|jgi:hypothetical protein|uniref:TIGR04076 family protein n=1 Tax=Candidatus Abyssobacteria bacterium SURF_17 TaxID=2093361 RepID=A0A419EXI7_9BACT|nr:MAG: hypothetical protein C4532_10745 [Candidatus Abyssubacteria bacterium SURF_17]
MRDPMLTAFAKEMLKMSDEDIEKVPPEQEQDFKNAMANFAKYRLVAEVAQARYCAAGVHVGQKLVLNGVQIDGDASDCPLCVGLIAPLERAWAVFLDRCYKNRDLTAPLGGVRCADPGLDAGGLGSVLFDVRIEEIG